METGAARAEYGGERSLERAWDPVQAPATGPAPIARGALDRFQNVPVEVEAQLDRKTMTLREILELDAGTIVPLGRSAGENIDILVGGALVAFGEIVVFEEVMGVRITAFNAEKE